MTLEDRIAELEKLEAKATKAPWWVEREREEDSLHHGYRAFILKYRWNDVPTWICESSERDANGDDFAFIAAARNALPELLRELKRTREALRRIDDITLDADSCRSIAAAALSPGDSTNRQNLLRLLDEIRPQG